MFRKVLNQRNTAKFYFWLEFVYYWFGFIEYEDSENLIHSVENLKDPNVGLFIDFKLVNS